MCFSQNCLSHDLRWTKSSTNVFPTCVCPSTGNISKACSVRCRLPVSAVASNATMAFCGAWRSNIGWTIQMDATGQKPPKKNTTWFGSTIHIGDTCVMLTYRCLTFGGCQSYLKEAHRAHQSLCEIEESGSNEHLRKRLGRLGSIRYW